VVPGTWLSVVFYVLLVAPGLWFDLLAERRRVGAPESAFREVSRVVLASLAFSGIALAVLAVIRAAEPAWMPDPRLLFANGHGYLAGRYRLVLRALLLEGGIALGLVWLVHWWKARSVTRLTTASAWQTALRDQGPEGFVPHVWVRMSDGMEYIGAVAQYTADLDLADRELVLGPPLFHRAAASHPLMDMPPEWQRLIIHGPAAQSIAVQYRPAPKV
jgi:hypothetical protein